MASVNERLKALREYLKTLSADKTTFIVEGGAEFYTEQDPIDYLCEHGPFTADGRRIVLYPHQVEGIDFLSLSIYQMIDAAIETGKLDLTELASDET